MAEFELKYLEYCPADGVLEYFYHEAFELKSRGMDFYQCYLEEESRNIEISRAYKEIKAGEQFAFYDLNILQFEQQLIAEMEITKFNNAIIQGVEGGNLKQEVYRVIQNMDGVEASSRQIEMISNLITRITSTIVGHGNAQDMVAPIV